MFDIDGIQESLLDELHKEGLDQDLDLSRSQFLDLSNEALVQLVLLDASVEDRVSQAVLRWLRTREDADAIEWGVSSLWSIKNVGPPEQARSETGSVVAASVIPVLLESGKSRVTQAVYVIVTYQAIQDLKVVEGRDPNLSDLAKAYVASRLQRQGRSAWNPRSVSRLEINAAQALDIRRTLAKTA